jgi:hypothetical protein
MLEICSYYWENFKPSPAPGPTELRNNIRQPVESRMLELPSTICGLFVKHSIDYWLGFRLAPASMPQGLKE